MEALIQNITAGYLQFPEFTLRRGETARVPYTPKLNDYAAEKYIKILKITGAKEGK